MILVNALLLLLLFYVAVYLGLGILKGRDYLREFKNNDDKEADLFFHSQNFTMAMSGLSITVLALFIGLNPNNISVFSDIVLFFAISFVTLSLSWNLVRFTRKVYGYLGGLLTDIGILSIGCGFLVFFYYRLPLFHILTLIFFAFILVFLALGAINLHKYQLFWHPPLCERKVNRIEIYKKTIKILLFTCIFSILVFALALVSQMPYAFIFLKLNPYLGLMPFRDFLRGILTISISIAIVAAMVSIVLLIFAFYPKIKAMKNSDIMPTFRKRRTLFRKIISISLLGVITLTSLVMLLFIPEIQQSRDNINIFVTNNKDRNLAQVIDNFREFIKFSKFNHSWNKPESVLEIDTIIFTNWIDKPVIESIGLDRGDVILYQQWGSCGQTALLTEEIMLKCGYTTRSAKFIGVDHQWTEVLYNGNWTIVDPWNSNGIYDIQDLALYYPDYQNAKGVEIQFRNGTIYQEYVAYGYEN